MRVRVKGLKGVEKLAGRLRRLPIRDMNRRRADQFRRKTRIYVGRNELGLPDISDATQKIQGKKHPRLHNKGVLIRSLEVQQAGTGARVGYFKNDKAAMIATLQQTGYRVPLFGSKGERVRAWLAVRGIFPRKTTKWMVVPPSPFMDLAVDRYERSGDDDRIIDQALDRIWRSL